MNRASPIKGSLTLVPTALFFGLGAGNLLGIANLVTRFSNGGLGFWIPLALACVLTIFLTSVARVWWPQAFMPLSFIVVVGWAFSGLWAAVQGKFSGHDLGIWLFVWLGCGIFAYLLAWLTRIRVRASSTAGLKE